MPQKTLQELKDQHFEQALHFFMAADLLEGTSSAEEADGDHVDENIVQGDEIPIMLWVLGAEWLGIAEALRGNGTRGPYFQFLKSADFFELALQMPDRLFRYMFRYAHFYLTWIEQLLIPSWISCPKIRSSFPEGESHSNQYHTNLHASSSGMDNSAALLKIQCSR
ncbi:hypothetical protein GGX14DRAFT_386724 [Mycena pura]|uniref:Uncharacterized protein n=1 Tax=Mycena pura TaxID=153505 RepID=A0AAD6YR22_9AGAR|nr:hypothetical protein GGX14DRAFT_386724 [Mycena pura]